MSAFINLWCQREKLWYALLMMANKPETAVQSSTYFLLASHGFFLHVYALAGYECLLASLPRLNPLCQHFFIRVLARCWPWSTGVGRGLGSKPGMSWHGQQHIPVAKSCGLVQNHKCCAQVSLYKLVMPEREVVVCSADEGQQARNSCPELHIFVFFYMLPPQNLPIILSIILNSHPYPLFC